MRQFFAALWQINAALMCFLAYLRQKTLTQTYSGTRRANFSNY
jgi:hypothetical protein